MTSKHLTLDEILERHMSYYRNSGDLENDMNSDKAEAQITALVKEIITEPKNKMTPAMIDPSIVRRATSLGINLEEQI